MKTLFNLEINKASIISNIIILFIVSTVYRIYIFEGNDFKFEASNIILGITIGSVLALSYNYYHLYSEQSFPKAYKITSSLVIETVLIGSFYEELFYKGIILKNLFTKYNYLLAIIITSLLFTVTHFSLIFQPVKFLTLFLLGIITCFSYFKTKNIIISIIIHSSYNLGIILIPNTL